jgi:hypothetical protein
MEHGPPYVGGMVDLLQNKVVRQGSTLDLMQNHHK